MLRTVILFLASVCLFGSASRIVGQTNQPQQSAPVLQEKLQGVELLAAQCLVSSQKFRDEFEILPSQLDEFKRTHRQIMDQSIKAFDLHEKQFFLNRNRDTESLREYEAAHEAFAKENQLVVYDQLSDALSRILMPFQMEPLKRSMRFVVINRLGSFPAFLQQEEIKKELNIDYKQAQRIDGESAELQKQFENELRDLKAKYRQMLIDTLKEDQQTKLHAILGDDLNSDYGIFSKKIRF